MLIYLRGIDMIQNIYDVSLIGLGLLTSVEQVGAVTYTLIISTILWLITVMIPVMSVYFSQLAVAKTGIM